jgi:hypothetical protein
MATATTCSVVATSVARQQGGPSSARWARATVGVRVGVGMGLGLGVGLGLELGLGLGLGLRLGGC